MDTEPPRFLRKKSSPPFRSKPAGTVLARSGTPQETTVRQLLF